MVYAVFTNFLDKFTVIICIKLLTSNFAHAAAISGCIWMKKLSTAVAVSTVERVNIHLQSVATSLAETIEHK